MTNNIKVPQGMRARVMMVELMKERFWMAPDATALSEVLDLVLEDVGPQTESVAIHLKFDDVDSNFRCKILHQFSYDGKTWSTGADLSSSYWAAPAGRTTNKIEAEVTDVTKFGKFMRFTLVYKSAAAAETWATLSASVAIKTFGS